MTKPLALVAALFLVLPSLRAHPGDIDPETPITYSDDGRASRIWPAIVLGQFALLVAYGLATRTRV